MSWLEHHRESGRLASQAQVALGECKQQEAMNLYIRAADAEVAALADLDASKARTLGISVVSATSLYFKASAYKQAEQVAFQWLGCASLPTFAVDQLRNLLQSIWSEQVREHSGIEFAPGQVLISVKGGEIIEGGAPLDMIVEKVQTVKSLFHRTAEFLVEIPHRKRGAPTRDIQESCRPWLFQTAPGSYQFAVAVQERPTQRDWLKRDLPVAREVANRFLRILHIGVEDPEGGLYDVVPDPDYRDTFLKLTRNLAPSGKVFDQMEIRSADGSRAVRLDPEVRRRIGKAIRTRNTSGGKSTGESTGEIGSLSGVLRAVHLDRDWFEVAASAEHFRVTKVEEQVDDVIGAMVNKPVIVHVRRHGEKLEFVDIEPDD